MIKVSVSATPAITITLPGREPFIIYDYQTALSLTLNLMTAIRMFPEHEEPNRG